MIINTKEYFFKCILCQSDLGEFTFNLRNLCYTCNEKEKIGGSERNDDMFGRDSYLGD